MKHDNAFRSAMQRPLSRRAFVSATVLTGAIGVAGFTGAGAVRRGAAASAAELDATARKRLEQNRAVAANPHVDPAQVAAKHASAQPFVWGTAMAGIMSRFETDRQQIALTLDACGGPRGSGFDQRIIDALRADRIPATLFLNARWIEANRDLTIALAHDPLFTIANHGSRHVPLSVTGRAAYNIVGTANSAEAVDEIWQCHELLTNICGHAPRFFRPGTAHYDDVAVQIVSEIGEQPLGFSINGDCGATLSAASVQSQLTAAVPGAIILAHMNQPNSPSGGGLIAGVRNLKAQGWEFVSLEDKRLVSA
ncbi:polysaccharide deacetylase family protein [Smaragdicoccus niigatensis]|uniref:polysaccharide deacetylase family protein n=1 Tax=Smaragdicoccus niigatensis TaxID=359359 RepID=UPI000377295E|nr:polysaccharide deacetylase family protein [Smaragdicoccus niigatensis]